MKNRYLVSILIPIAILVSMTVLPLATTLWGHEITIKTKPVDPTDLFRGDYVILDYEISDLKLGYFPEITKVKKDLNNYETTKQFMNKKVYVELKEANGIYVVKEAGFNKPTSGVYLTGKIEYFYQTPPPFPGEKPMPDTPWVEPIPDTVKINYSLDKYFVPENTGLKLEELSRKGQLVATVKVRDGYAILVDIKESK